MTTKDYDDYYRFVPRIGGDETTDDESEVQPVPVPPAEPRD